MEQGSMKKYVAEAFGTFVLTFFGCGSAAIAGNVLGNLGIAFAFGLSIVAMAFVIGGISGCHINPAVSLGLYLDNRMSTEDFIGYIIGQFVGGFVAALTLWLIIATCSVFAPYGGVLATGLGCNGFDEASSVGMNMGGAFLIEIILTCIFVLVVLGSTSNEKVAPFAGLIIGLALTFVHIMGIPLTGTSVNPARSFGPALVMAFNGVYLPMAQVWLFICAPAIGAIIAALIWRGFKPEDEKADVVVIDDTVVMPAREADKAIARGEVEGAPEPYSAEEVIDPDYEPLPDEIQRDNTYPPENR